MCGLAVGSLVSSGVDLRWVSTGQSRYAGIVLVSVPFVLQLLACVLAYLARDGAAGAAMGVVATTWLAYGAVEIVSAPGHTSGALGLLLITTAGLVVLSSIAAATGKPLIGVVLVIAGARFALAATYELGGAHGVQTAAGVVGLVVTGLAAYAVLAFELEGQGTPMLPTFRTGPGRAALSGGAAALDDPLHEAGVRQTT